MVIVTAMPGEEGCCVFGSFALGCRVTRRWRAAALMLGGAGLLTMVVGTFLPWLRSGDVQRNSYASFGVLRRLIGFHGAAEALVRAWPLLGAVSAAIVVLAAFGLLRAAALLALIVAAWAGAVSAGALARGPAPGVWIESIGPIVTIAGAAATAAAAIRIFVAPLWRRRAVGERTTERTV